MSGEPLEGVRVVELAEGIAGPMTGRLLGDAGADVIKVELLSGDRARGWGPSAHDGVSAVFRSVNRNKRSFLAESQTDDTVQSLIAGADVLIVDYGLLDVEVLMEAHPHLMVCVISGWGPKGPWAERAGGELPAQLISGATSSLGRSREEPVRLASEHAGMTTAFHAMEAVVAALIAADDVGGQRIDVSLLGSLIEMRSTLWVALSDPDDWRGHHLDGWIKPPEHGYTCKDRLIYFRVTRVKDFDQLISDLDMEFAREDPRWAMFRADTAGFVGGNGHLVHDIWDRGLAKWNFAEAAEIIEGHGGWAFPIATYDDFVHNSQVQHEGMVQTIPGSDAQQLRPPWQFSDTPASIRLPAPKLGEHNAEIVQELLVE